MTIGMNIGIITVRDRDYHPNRRFSEAEDGFQKQPLSKATG